MNSTETFAGARFDGALKEEKGKLYAAALDAKDTGYAGPDPEAASYWIPYAGSKHLDGGALGVFDASELLPLREQLTALWRDDAEATKCLPIVVSACYRTRDDRKNYLEKVDLYNYMM